MVAIVVAVVAGCTAVAVWLSLRPPGAIARLRRRRPGAGGAAAVDDAALAAELLAAVLRGGLPVAGALEAVAAVCSTAPPEPSPARALRLLAAEARGAPPGHVRFPLAVMPIVEAVRFSAATGSPVAAALEQAAATARRRRRDAALRAAGRLSASLVLPLGLCALPGFLLLGVAPVVVRLVAAIA